MKCEPLPAPVVVASDVHLSPRDPAGVERFLAFVRGPASESGSVVLAGDLFDVWVSSATGDHPVLRPAITALSRLAADGVRVGFVEGNRDFAAAPALRAAGVRLLPDVLVVEDGPLRVVVTHGDLLCRNDVRYQAFRRLVRTGTARHLLRSVPVALAEACGGAARSVSRAETSRKAYGSMGLDAGAVAGLLRGTRADVLVCGHVHWGRSHRIEVDGRDREVVVLGAWDAGDATYARIAGGACRFVRWSGLSESPAESPAVGPPRSPPRSPPGAANPGGAAGRSG